MSTLHPSPDLLRRFLDGVLPKAELRRIVRHLLRGCGRCQGSVRQIAAALRVAPKAQLPAPRQVGYEGVFERLRDRLSNQRRAHRSHLLAAPTLLAELLSEPAECRLTLALRDRRFVSLPLVEELILASRDRLFDAPREAIERAELAVTVSGRLDSEIYGAAVTADLCCRAWACLANARRVVGNRPGAEQAFHLAEAFLADGSGDPLERACFLSLLASLRNEQECFDDGDALLCEAAAIYRAAGDRAGWGKTLIQRGLAAGHRDDLEAAVRLLQEGADLIEPEADPRLVLCALHNLLWSLANADRAGEALLRLQKARPTYEALGDRLNLLRLRWLEGRIARKLGQFERAESILLEVRRSWVAGDPGREAALAALDLAMVYAVQGRAAPMRRLAQEMYTIFFAQDMQKEAIVALIVFQQAAERGAVTIGLVRELAHLVEHLAPLVRT